MPFYVYWKITFVNCIIIGIRFKNHLLILLFLYRYDDIAVVDLKHGREVLIDFKRYIVQTAIVHYLL